LVAGPARLEAPCALLYVPGGDLTRIDGGQGERVGVPERAVLVEIFPA
jgi:hypothetical protein